MDALSRMNCGCSCSPCSQDHHCERPDCFDADGREPLGLDEAVTATRKGLGGSSGLKGTEDEMKKVREKARKRFAGSTRWQEFMEALDKEEPGRSAGKTKRMNQLIRELYR